MPDRRACLLSALGEVAWADGLLRPEEARFFVDVISQLELPPGEVAGVYRNVLAPGPIEELDLSSFDNDDRRWVLGFGYLMASADGEVAAEELAVLRALAGRLGISWEEAEGLFAEAETLLPAVRDAQKAGDNT